MGGACILFVLIYRTTLCMLRASQPDRPIYSPYHNTDDFIMSHFGPWWDWEGSTIERVLKKIDSLVDLVHDLSLEE